MSDLKGPVASRMAAEWKRQLTKNEQRIDSLRSGEFAHSESWAGEAIAELRDQNEHLRSLLRQRSAFQRRQSALRAIAALMLAGQAAPAATVAEFEAAQSEFSAASAAVDRISEIRRGK